MTDFARINQPRVEKILAMLNTIEKSARSQKASDDVAALLAPVAERIAALTAAPAEAAPAAPAAKPAPVADEAFATCLEAVRGLSYHRVGLLSAAIPEPHVAGVVTHLVNRLAERPAP